MNTFDDAIHLMLARSGSFAQAIASAHIVADPINRAKLRAAFPELFGRYETMFEQLEAEARHG